LYGQDRDRTDGSAASAEALDLGLELAAREDSTARLVHVPPVVDVLPVADLGTMPTVPHELNEADRAPSTKLSEPASYGDGSGSR
jgi:nucleotide-binding universal stress UspA family protein